MRVPPRRLLSGLAAAVALTVLLACGGDEDLQAFVRSATPTPAPASGSLAGAEPTATVDSGASGSIARNGSTPTAAPANVDGNTGAISGALSYPGEGIPRLRIVAFRTGSGDWYSVDTEVDQAQYTLTGLAPGTYQVVAYVREPGLPSLSAGYSQYILCGAVYGCEDHTLVDVAVAAGQTVEGIDPGDWYAPDDAFPPEPTL